MSNLIVDGFAHYANPAAGAVGNDQRSAMLAGAWADVGGLNDIRTLPWVATDTKLWAVVADGATVFGSPGIRRVLPHTVTTLIASFYWAIPILPSSNYTAHVIQFRNGANAAQVGLGVTSTGALWVGSFSPLNVMLETSGPVMVAQSAVHVEIKYTPGTGSNGSIEVRINGVTVLSGENLTIPNAGPVAQFVMGFTPSLSGPLYYVADLIVRDTAGDVNNDFMGDRRVATLLVDGDDLAHQGWAGRTLRRFGNGILKCGTAPFPNRTPNTNGGAACGITTDTNLTNLDFCIETQVRFQRLPSGSSYMTLFGKWDEPADQRSYQLILCGPSLFNGDLVWRISTDGTAATVVNRIRYPWKPVVGRWYHLAVQRASGVTTIFVDGQPLGTGTADADAYFSGSARTALGAETSGGNSVEGKSTVGWFDEFRMTKGSTRYTGTFVPPSDKFPRGPIDDPLWSDVVWLSGWDTASVTDESGFARPLSALGFGSTSAITPPDGGFNFNVIGKDTFQDDNFVEAALLPATGVLTQTALPTNNETVTVGTKDGSDPAVYTWKTTLSGGGNPFEVLIGATILESLANLIAAIMAGAGAGTVYGNGTTANFDVFAEPLPVNQMLVVANVPGTSGNSIAVATTDPNGTWGTGVTTLSGGEDIPPYSQFTFQRPPAGAVVVDSVTIVRRTWKTDAGDCQVRASFVGPGDGVLHGTVVNESVTPTLRHDTFEFDPDAPSNPLTLTAVVQGRVRIDRLV